MEILTHSINQRPKLSEVDIAFELLQAQGSPKNYHDLIVEVLQSLDMPIDATRISSVLTQINLDTRFAYAGQGEWSLKAWVPAKSAKKLPAITLMNKAIAHDDEIDKDFSEEANEDLEGQEFDLEDEISEIEDSFELDQEVDRREDKWG
ncbi:MAG: DNA-directed RNA polymerase subunit delta [Desulfitobacteriaceae bacterium]